MGIKVGGRFGQEPTSFERFGEVNEVWPVELSDAPTNEENTTGFEAAVQWSQRTLRGLVGEDLSDPVEELGGPAVAASDWLKAEALHAARSVSPDH